MSNVIEAQGRWPDTPTDKNNKSLRHGGGGGDDGGMDAPGWKLHKLSGKTPKGQAIQDHWAVSVSGNWRLTFYFEGKDAVLVDYQDYH